MANQRRLEIEQVAGELFADLLASDALTFECARIVPLDGVPYTVRVSRPADDPWAGKQKPLVPPATMSTRCPDVGEHLPASLPGDADEHPAAMGIHQPQSQKPISEGESSQ